MPCDSSYLEPNQREIAMSNMYLLLKELKTKKSVNPDDYGQGYHEKAYCKRITQKDIDMLTAKLCAKISKIEDISQYSLELQLWWREHQQHDERRQLKEGTLKLEDCSLETQKWWRDTQE